MAAAGVLLASAALEPAARAAPSYTLFESGQVRPLAFSPDKKLLFAVNTPDNRLEVFRVKPEGLARLTSIPVGLEPVAVAARRNDEVWVVNHLSDSVSVVALEANGSRGHVARTLLVGDEPRDIVFAGPGQSRAFITTAHRGQSVPYDPQLLTPGVGRADVWVFDANQLGVSSGGDPLTIATLFTDTPRALAVSPDGSYVYAAGFHSGNQTTTVHELLVPDGFGPDGVLPPDTNYSGDPAPEVSIIVKWDGEHWRDEAARIWDSAVAFSLPDKDVFVLDAMANPPQQVAGASGFFSGVGTILYNMAVNPVNGHVYVSNTDANNNHRFEGPGIFAGHSVRGHLHESRITVLTPGGGAASRHLNKHINYARCVGNNLPPNSTVCALDPVENAKSLALPMGMAVTSDGTKLYVAAMGSDKVGVFDTAQLESDTFVPSAANHISVSGGGPTGLVLDEANSRMYVLTRFDNAVSVINTTTRAEIGHLPMHNPEPPTVTAGRRFLYDARNTSSNGEAACASCHVFGDFDSLAWDLGNPDGDVEVNPGPFITPLHNFITNQPMSPDFHPMKGPMATQSLRGMANHGPMHWRGDRTGGNDAPTAQPDSGTFDERAAFKKFQVAFSDLLGRSGPIPEADMEAFTDFILQVMYPPNPNRPLDNVLTVNQAAGSALFENTHCGVPQCFGEGCPINRCIDCHVLDPNGNPGSAAPGFFGAAGFSGFAFESQFLKIPHFRNLYQKVGMFGNTEILGFLTTDTGFKGEQVRGFGYLHDGALDTVFRFHHGASFAELANPPGLSALPNPGEPNAELTRLQLTEFLLAFPTNLAPAVGQQVTLTPGNAAAASARIALLMAQADAGACELVVKTKVFGNEVGFLYLGAGEFASDRQGYPHVTDAELRQPATTFGRPLTYTCVPPGSGVRIGVDRDGDGYWDGDEQDAGSDPADPTSTP